jgi:hypothetical protein
MDAAVNTAIQGAAARQPLPAQPLPRIPLGELVTYLSFAGLLLLLLLYFVGAEQGATSLVAGTSVHEFVHDARHLLGFPCH